MMKDRYRSWSIGEEVRVSQSSSTIWHEICVRVLEVISQTRWMDNGGWMVSESLA